MKMTQFQVTHRLVFLSGAFSQHPMEKFVTHYIVYVVREVNFICYVDQFFVQLNAESLFESVCMFFVACRAHHDSVILNEKKEN